MLTEQPLKLISAHECNNNNNNNNNDNNNKNNFDVTPSGPVWDSLYNVHGAMELTLGYAFLFLKNF